MKNNKLKDKIEKYDWTEWNSFPNPSDYDGINLRHIFRKILLKPYSTGVYQIRDNKTGEKILFGKTTKRTLELRMGSLLPLDDGGISGRNNKDKKNHISKNIENMEFRVLYLPENDATKIEREIKLLKNHKYNT